jgi:hypothetical protein
MDDTKKMLRAIINGQSALRDDLIREIRKGDESLSRRIDSLENEIRNGFQKVNKRIDRLGKQLAYLDDDAPTGEKQKLSRK